MANTAQWVGASGQTYTYYVHSWPTEFTDKRGGNYIFCKIVNQKWKAIYIGETGNFSERFDNHHAMPCIERQGATHIHAHLNTNESARLAEEDDLIQNHNPPCNG